MTSTCGVINWTFRKFPSLPKNRVIERIVIGHFAPIVRTIDFDGSDAAHTTAMNAPPGRSRIDTAAKWKGNGVQGGFDIHSRKHCPPAPAFTIEKLQKIAGSGEGFATSPLSAQINQVVDYEMIVRNTGNVPLVLSNFSDPRCDPATISGGQGETPLAPGPTPSLGGSTIYTCEHTVTSVNVYENNATVIATPPGGTPIAHTSNTVVVSVPAPPPGPRIYLGYADTGRSNGGSPSGHPTPWQGSPGVSFIGCGFGGVDSCPMSGGVDVYDAGAIRIDATASSGPVSVTGGKVVIGPCTYEPWPSLSVTIQPEHTLILTQTGKHRCSSSSTAEQDNFDTSESFLKSPQYQQFLKGGPCSNDGYVPALTLTVNGQTATLNDTSQTLNTGGIDPDICHHTSEAINWVKLQAPASRFAHVIVHRASRAHRRHGHVRARRPQRASAHALASEAPLTIYPSARPARSAR